MNQEEIRFGYAVCYSSSVSGYIGAILITDYKGFPIEFQYTDPISPTKIQQVLYGNGLEKYIKVNVALESLLKVISNSIDILIVQDEDLLMHSAENLSTIRISATKAMPLPNHGDISKVKNNEYLVQTSVTNNPIRIQLKSNISEESEEFKNLINIVTEAGYYMDITEPLNRVYKAVELICNQDI